MKNVCGWIALFSLCAAVSGCGGGSSGSGGPKQASVPNVVGDTQAAATTAIDGANLTVGTVTQQSSSTVASGEVISETPAAGTSVAQASAVALVVSTGPQTQTVGGILIGLAGGASVTISNGVDDVPISANGSFTLPTAVPSGSTYSVSVGVPTTVKAQSCAVQNGTGTIAANNVTNVIVFCTYTVSAATLDNTYTVVTGNFDVNNTSASADSLATEQFNGAGAVSGSLTTTNYNGIIAGPIAVSGTYALSSGNPSSLTGLGGQTGGIEGVNAVSFVSVGTTSGTPPNMSIAVLPDTAATTASINGNYTLVNLSAQLSSGKMYGYEANITLTNGNISGTFTQNLAGTTLTTGQASGQWIVGSGNGLLTAVAAGSGAVSADGDLIVFADTTSGDDPNINVAVPRGTGVSQATVQGVYSVAVYAGTQITATGGSAITFFAYGNGTWSDSSVHNADGTVTTAGNTDSGTYTVTADGTLTVTDSEGDVYNGAISADGNTLVLSSIANDQPPRLFVGVRQ